MIIDMNIDVVITYVDGDDPIWVKSKNKYDTTKETTLESASKWRFKSNNEALYCIKSINKFAPFFRKIYLVMSGPSQNPIWLNEVNKLHIPLVVIYHSQFYIDKSHLPVFNSTSIEANIHNIPGLSEYFVYFNDDCFLGDHVTKNDFISDDGKLLIQLDRPDSKRGKPSKNEIGYYSAWKNTNNMLDRIFQDTVPKSMFYKHLFTYVYKPDYRIGWERNVIKHVPQVQKKSTHKKLRTIFPEEFEENSRSRFRSIYIYNTSAGLAEYYELYTGNALQYNTSSLSILVNDYTYWNTIVFSAALYDTFKFINIQSTITVNGEDADTQLKEFLENTVNKMVS